MLESGKGGVKNPSSTLIAFKPRQVLLAEQHQKPTSSSSSSNKLNLMAVMEEKKKRKKQQQQHSEKTLTPEQNIQLLHSVLKYLESNHYSKSLKRLLKESQIQGESWKASTLDVADMYCKYLENCNLVDAKLANYKELEVQDDELEQRGNAFASQETLSKKKEKKKKEKDSSENIASHKDTESEVKLIEQKDKKMDSLRDATLSAVCDSEVDKSSKKHKKKDKNKLTSESLGQDAKQPALKSGLTEEKLKNDNGETDFEETAKSKYKNKKRKSNTEPVAEDQKLNESKNSNILVDDKSNSEIPLEENEVKPKEKKKKKEKKSSVTSENGIDNDNGTKKRKRVTSHDNEIKPVEESVNAETKRRKIEGHKLPGGEGQGKESEEENGKVDINECEKSSINRIGENTNGNVKNGFEKSGERKQRNGSAQPKTVNAFQRVKVDEVQFVDERLQDNSYWAKDGAEIGYGAKAQEVLGQVRGRDFRHEKTKKKRGSYRGGLIDLQSHSIKFNYSDEE